MSRASTPIRAPHAIRAAIVEDAKNRGLTVAEYMSKLTELAEDRLVHQRLAQLRQSFVTMRTGDAEIVRKLASQFDRRQWEVLYELFRAINDRP